MHIIAMHAQAISCLLPLIALLLLAFQYYRHSSKTSSAHFSFPRDDVLSVPQTIIAITPAKTYPLFSEP
jgi:hypothetical protein